MEQNKTIWKYETLLVTTGVRVQVPKESQFMKFFPAHTFESADGPVVVPDHWKSGMTVDGTKTDTMILNRHFYGISRDDLGSKITAIIKVVEKREVGGDRVYVMLDMTKDSGRTVADLKISSEGDGILIAGTRTRINIVKRGSADSKLEAAQTAPPA